MPSISEKIWISIDTEEGEVFKRQLSLELPQRQLGLIRSIQGNWKSGICFVFWARDFLTTWRNPKQEFFDLGQSHMPTANRESQNGKCPLRGHILAFALCTSSVADCDHIYDHMCHWFIWGDDLFEILCNFSFFEPLLKLCKYAMPFQQKHSAESFYR